MRSPDPSPLEDHPDWRAFFHAMEAAPGDATPPLVFADWLEEHDRPMLAEAVRAQTPKLAARYARCAACRGTLLGANLQIARPYPMPAPDRGHYRSRAQWRGIVRTALKPFALANVTVASAPGWRGGPDIELRVPGADFYVAGAFPLPWTITSAGMIEAATLVFVALMPRLFPGEPARVVYDDQGEFQTHFWRVETRPPT